MGVPSGGRSDGIVGDAEVDAVAALRAGVDYCHANWGYGKTKLDHVTFVNDIQSLLIFLKIEEKH